MSKVITDPVHGAIHLDDAAVRLMQTREFQRLRRVKQLGLVSMVFPSADYSRFAHSCGVHHIARLMVRGLGDDLDPDEGDTVALAALLHDIGHYPFSHTTEIAMEEHYPEIVKTYLVPRDEAAEPGGQKPYAVGEPLNGDDGEPNRGYMDHEEVGARLVRTNPALRAALPDNVKPNDIANLITGKDSKFYASIVKSDLDADRLDYLLRDGYFSGLPFGRVDLEYLVSQLRVTRHNSAKRLGYRVRATNAVDHMLMARYFAYQQLVFHKTAAAFEWLLVDVMKAMLEAADQPHGLDFSRAGVMELVDSGRWADVDDGYLLGKISAFAAKSEGLVREKADAILRRRPPRTIPVCEGFIGLSVAKNQKATWDDRTSALIDNVTATAGIARERVRCWGVTFKFVHNLDKVPSTEAERDSVVMIRDESTNDTAYLQADRMSLMHALSRKRYRIERVYVLPQLDQSESQVSALLAHVRAAAEKHLRA